jgi:hypothetical protein
MKTLSLLLLAFLVYLPAHATTMEELLTVKTVDGQKATLEGKTDGLKAGDQLYFARSPFHFTITEVKGEKITITLPGNHDVKVGNTMLRTPTPSMKKAIDTEDRLKKALED